MNQKSDIYFWTTAACIYKNTFWFVYGKFGLMCKADLADNRVKVVGKLPTELFVQQDAYYKMIPLDDKLYLVPFWGNRIIIYDIKTGQSDYIALNNSGSNFQNAFVENDNIVFLPAGYPSIVVLDCNNRKVSELNIDQRKKIGVSAFNASDRITDGKYALVSPEVGTVVIYDLYKNTLDYIEFEGKTRRFSTVACLYDFIYVCSNSTKEIIKYDMRLKRETGVFWIEGRDWLALRRIGDWLLVDDVNSAWIGIYNEDFKCMYEYDGEYIENRLPYYSFMSGKVVEGERNSYFNNADANLLLFDSIGEVKKLSFPVDDYLKRIINKARMSEKKQMVVYEDGVINLSDYISNI